jgi:hypothetical protein
MMPNFAGADKIFPKNQEMGDITIEKLGCQIKISHATMVLPYALAPVGSIHTGRKRLTPFDKRHNIYNGVVQILFCYSLRFSERKDADL